MKTLSNKTIDLGCKRPTSANVLIYQNNIHQKHFDEMISIYEKETQYEENFDYAPISARVENILAKVDVLEKEIEKEISDPEINLIVMPELSVMECHLERIKKWSKLKENTVIVAGSCYKKYGTKGKKYCSAANIIFRGNIHEVYKLTPAPDENTFDNIEIKGRKGICDFIRLMTSLRVNFVDLLK